MLGPAVLALLCFLGAARELSQSKSDVQLYAFMAVGDYGTGGDAQYHVAAQMDATKARIGADLVVGVGDNFYPDGVSSTSDNLWYTHWYKVYKEKAINMKDVPWHAVLGNHDYCSNAKAQIQYNQHKWRMDDFFWVHQFNAGPQKVAFVYLDTDLLAYGLDTPGWLKRSCPNMERQFKQYAEDPKMRWSQDEHLRIVREKLDYVQDADWIIVFGHHPVGGGFCGGEGRLSELMNIFETRRVSAYVHGHVHALSYGLHKGVSYVMTGAGSDRMGADCRGGGYGGVWSEDTVAGFVYFRIYDNRMQITYLDEKGDRLYQATQWRR